MNKEKDSEYPLIQRIVFFLAGFSNPLIGYAIYYMFKEDKTKDWQVELIQRGSIFCLAFLLIGLIISIITAVISFLF